MVSGINTDVHFRGVVYHVQTEDFGRAKPKIKTFVLDEGAVVTAIESSYARLANSPDFDEKEVARRLAAQHWKAAKDLREGRLYLDGKTAIEEEYADPLVDAEPEVEKTVATATDPSPAPMPSDRRITMLAMALAAVSVTLAVLTLLSLYPFSPHGSRPAPASAAFASSRPIPPPVEPAIAVANESDVCNVTVADQDIRASAEPAALVEPSRDRPVPRSTAATVKKPAPVKTAAPARTKASPTRATTAGSRSRNPVPPAPKPKPAPPVAPEPALAEDPPAPVVESVDSPAPPESAPEEPAVKPAEGEPYQLADVDVPPRLASHEMPVYTRRASRKRQEGSVALNLLIDERGRVANLRLKWTIPDSDLNEVVIDTVRRWRFDPARKAGIPVRVWKPLTIDFSIDSGRERVRFLE